MVEDAGIVFQIGSQRRNGRNYHAANDYINRVSLGISYGPIDAAYNHSIANIMTKAALRTGLKSTFNEKSPDVLAGNKVFKYLS